MKAMSVNSASFVSVFLILTVVAIGSRPISAGLAVKVVLLQNRQIENCDQRLVILQVLANSDVRLNAEYMTKQRLGKGLDDVFLTRADRVLLIEGEATASFEQVAKTIEAAREHVGSIVLLTPSVDMNRCLAISASPLH